jgi:hypothetical protein
VAAAAAPSVAFAPAGEGHGVSSGELSALKAELTRLSSRVDLLEGLVHRLTRELGVSDS